MGATRKTYVEKLLPGGHYSLGTSSAELQTDVQISNIPNILWVQPCAASTISWANKVHLKTGYICRQNTVQNVKLDE